MNRITLYLVLMIMCFLCGCAVRYNDPELASASTDDLWVEALASAIADNNEHFRYMTLIDVDFDGIPEVFLYTSGNVSTWTVKGFNYKNGTVTEIDTSFLFTDLVLFLDNDSGEQFWVTRMSNRSGAGFAYITFWCKVDFSGLPLAETEILFGFSEWYVRNGEDLDPAEFYLIGDKSDILTWYGTLTEFAEIERLRDDFLSRYTEIETFQLSKYSGDLLIDYNVGWDKENINEDAIKGFLYTWYD